MNNYIGKNSIRVEGREKVGGKAKYAADYYFDGMLYAVLVRSEYAHAEILSVDTSSVTDAYVFTAEDLYENVIEDIICDQPVFADKKTRFMGEPIAVIAADTLEKAKEQINNIKIKYNPLPVYINAEDAAEQEATKIHENGNIAGSFENTKGDPEKAFCESDLVIEHVFSTPYQEHAYMEPDAGVCYYENGKLVMITATQNVFHDKRMVMRALGLKSEEVQVKSATVGGGFGGKDGHLTQIFTALVTVKTGKPCKMVFDRTESTAFTYKRHGASMKVKIGFKNDGTIIAFDSDNIIDTGAYIGYGLSVLGLLSEHSPGPYNIENIHVHSRLIYTNKTPASAFRGFGAPQAAFATESIINEASEALGIDPIELRRKNALKKGDSGSLGQKVDKTVGLISALDALEKTELWISGKNADKNTGIGMAAGHLSCGFGKGIPDNAEIELRKENGVYKFFLGFTDIGQGSRTSLTQIAADALGVTAEKIEIIMADTDITFDCGSTAASRSTFLGGNAIIASANEYKRREASGEKDINVHITVPFPESCSMTAIGLPHAMYTFVVQAVKLKVNPLTGEITLLDVAAVTEAGTVVNPMQLNGQVQGGIAQSLGFSTSENCIFNENGKMLNPDFSTYLIPTFADVPHICSEAVLTYEESGPNGVKGAAESPTVPTAAAVNAAIFAATGKRFYSLPITPEKILLS